MKLKTIFDEYRDHNWWFVRPGGNWGDFLIYEGADYLANNIGLNWRTVDLSEFLETTVIPKRTCIYIHGGGGYNSFCSGKPFSILQKAYQLDASLVVQGPCTLSEENGFLEPRIEDVLTNRRCDRILFFVREEVSREVAQSLCLLNRVAELHIDHDTAFLLRNSDTLRDLTRGCTPSLIDLWIERIDGERNSSPIAPSIACLRIDPAQKCGSFLEWAQVHARARRIFSNRLHSAIFAHLLGKEVVVYPGSYHKVRSVWEYSMKNEGVLWGPTDYKTPAFSAVLPSKLYSSYKISNFLYKRFFNPTGI